MIRTITVLVTGIQFFMALTKVINVLILKGPHTPKSYRHGFLKDECPKIGHWILSLNSYHQRMQEGLIFVLAGMFQSQE